MAKLFELFGIPTPHSHTHEMPHKVCLSMILRAAEPETAQWTQEKESVKDKSFCRGVVGAGTSEPRASCILNKQPTTEFHSS